MKDWRSQGKLLPQNLESQVESESDSLLDAQEPKPQLRPIRSSHLESILVGIVKTVIEELLKAQG